MDIKNALIREYEIKSYEVNSNNKLKVTNLLHLFEDVAYQSAEELGFGYTDVYTKGLAWFLVKCRMNFKDLPSAWDKVKIKTWPIKSKGITCRRDFEIYKNDEKIGSASTLWAVVDIKTRRLINPFKALNFPELDENVAMDVAFDKIPQLENIDFEKDITIKFDDMDINGHVNNSNYISWAQDSLGYEFLKNHAPKNIEIDYKKEATYQTKIVKSFASYNNEEKTSLHLLKGEDDVELAQIKIEWIN